MESLGQVLPKAKLSINQPQLAQVFKLSKTAFWLSYHIIPTILNWTYSIYTIYKASTSKLQRLVCHCLGAILLSLKHKLVGLDSSTEVFDCWRLTNRYSTISVLPCLATRWRNDSEDTEKFGCICVLRRLRSALNNKKKKVRRPH